MIQSAVELLLQLREGQKFTFQLATSIALQVEVSMLNQLASLEDMGLSQSNHSWLHSSRQAKCFSVLSEQPIKGKIRTATNPVVNRSPLGCQVLGVRWSYDLLVFL